MSKDKERMLKAFEHGKAVGVYVMGDLPGRYAPLTFDSWYAMFTETADGWPNKVINRDKVFHSLLDWANADIGRSIDTAEWARRKNEEEYLVDMCKFINIEIPYYTKEEITYLREQL